MNRKLSGEELTTEDFVAIAIGAGLATEEELDARLAALEDRLFPDFLRTLTRNVRFEMFCRGELNLDTRNELNAPD